MEPSLFAFLPLLRLAPRIGVYFFMPMLDLCRIFTATTMSMVFHLPNGLVLLLHSG